MRYLSKKRLLIKYLFLLPLFIFSLNTRAQNVFPSSGNVGIGTSSPTSPFDVYVPASFRTTAYFYNTAWAYEQSTGKYFGFSTLNGKGNLYMNDGSPLILQRNGGNIGIGTLNPGYALDVHEPAAFRNSLYIYNTAWAYEQSSDKYLGMMTLNGKGDLSMQDNSDLVFQRNGGKIGIGTTSPLSKLHISGTGNDTVIRIQDSNNEDTENSYFGGVSGLDSSGDQVWFLGEGSDASKIVGLYSYSTGYDLNLWNNGNALSIKDNGEFVMGSNTHHAQLKVNGSIRTKEVTVEAANWPDYVFSQDYELISLQEIERHIQEKKHLPNIPSAEEVAKNGIEVGEMNKLLLEKVEELTLHILELNRRIEALEGEK